MILPHCHFYRRSGVALILVVIVIALLTTAGLSFALLMKQNHQFANQASLQYQSELSAESARSVALAFAGGSENRRQQLGGSYFVQSFEFQTIGSDQSLTSLNDSSDWTESSQWDDAQSSSMEAGEDFQWDPSSPGFVIFESLASTAETQVWSTVSTENEILLGLSDECQKLNLPRLLQLEKQGVDISLVLQQHCGLNARQADLLLDWVDADSQPRDQGGEREYYEQLGLGYAPPNRLPDSHLQLSMIPGFSAQQIWGDQRLLPDWQSESSWDDVSLDDRPTSSWADNVDSQGSTSTATTDLLGDAEIQQPLLETLGWYTHHRLSNPAGQPLLWMNQPDLKSLEPQLASLFDDELARYICLGRQFGFQAGFVDSPPPKTVITSAVNVPLDDTQAAVPLRSVFQLIESHVLIPGAETSQLVNSPLRLVPGDPTISDKVVSLLQNSHCLPAPQVQLGRFHYLHPIARQLPGLGETAVQWLTEQQSEGGMLETSGLGSSTSPQSQWYQKLVSGYLDGSLQLDEVQILEQNLCGSSDTFSGWVFAHSGDYAHPILQRIVVEGSADGSRQLYCQSVFPSPDWLTQLVQKLAESTPSPLPRPTSSP